MILYLWKSNLNIFNGSSKLKSFNLNSFAHYKEGSPVFIWIGGEGPGQDPTFLVAGAWMEWVKKHNAALFTLEHRFYGESHPTPDLSTENLVWLSSR